MLTYSGCEMPNLQGLNVLLVEDEALVAMMVEDWLEELGCRVTGTASNLRMARTLAGGQSIDVALLDLHLGDGTTFGLAEEILQRGIPVVFASGDSTPLPPPYERTPTLLKPYSLDELRVVLGRAVAVPS
jgi:CheY-like chemotaxis protein